MDVLWKCDCCGESHGSYDLTYCAVCITKERGAATLRSERTTAARNAALEDAALAVEDIDVVEARGMMGSMYAQLGDASATKRAAVAAIRALKTSPGEKEAT